VRFVRAFARFWWDFVVGDEWRIALIVGAVALLGGLAAAGDVAPGRLIAIAVAVAVMLGVCAMLVVSGRRRAARG
jgi:hypothetical protein